MLGATSIERHITLDRTMYGSDLNLKKKITILLKKLVYQTILSAIMLKLLSTYLKR